MLQKNAVEKSTLELLNRLQADKLFDNFILAGGTGLALHLGHRKSEDIDLFTIDPFNEEYFLSELERRYGFILDLRDKNTLKGAIDNVKVDFITHHYKQIRHIQSEYGLRIFSMEDIAAMKVNAIAGDGTRVKDFIDLYFLLKEFSFKSIVSFFEEKYNQRNVMHAIKSVVFFDDVILADWPILIKEDSLTWDKIKSVIEKHCTDYLQDLNNNNENEFL